MLGRGCALEALENLSARATSVSLLAFCPRWAAGEALRRRRSTMPRAPQDRAKAPKDQAGVTDAGDYAEV
jgi:hypothetical protein